ncbi:MAG: hypothetical protein BRD30_06700 [Bacteroidetes bacterium QH_2_63_10]|nr:MAG: hypothetical protein BRD30_06700 [Bacteroidetes bacterium QH_2_63_10]
MAPPAENGRPSSHESPGPRTDLLSSDPTDRTDAEPIYQGSVDTDQTVVVCGAGSNATEYSPGCAHAQGDCGEAVRQRGHRDLGRRDAL